MASIPLRRRALNILLLFALLLLLARTLSGLQWSPRPPPGQEPTQAQRLYRWASVRSAMAGEYVRALGGAAWAAVAGTRTAPARTDGDPFRNDRLYQQLKARGEPVDRYLRDFLRLTPGDALNEAGALRGVWSLFPVGMKSEDAVRVMLERLGPHREAHSGHWPADGIADSVDHYGYTAETDDVVNVCGTSVYGGRKIMQLSCYPRSSPGSEERTLLNRGWTLIVNFDDDERVVGYQVFMHNSPCWVSGQATAACFEGAGRLCADSGGHWVGGTAALSEEQQHWISYTGLPHCVWPTRDGGRACRNGSDCQGACEPEAATMRCACTVSTEASRASFCMDGKPQSIVVN